MRSVRIVEIEISRTWPSLSELASSGSVTALLRLNGTPLGLTALPPFGHGASSVIPGLLEADGSRILRQLLREALLEPVPPAGLDPDALMRTRPAPPLDEPPMVSVAVCTRDRPGELANCLEAIGRLEYAPLEVLVVDNAPATEAARTLVSGRFPQVRYIREPRPGLDWARNRAIYESRGEIVAFADDDVVVDPGWAAALARLFQENPEVMAATGLVLPLELETEAQRQFERYGGFGRGFERRWYHVPGGRGTARHHAGAGKFGTGANMAFRRTLFSRIGGFDPALDVGTVTNGGGDLEMFFRVLKTGHTLVYEPAALVWHRHRRREDQLLAQISNNGIGFYSYLVRSAHNFPDERVDLLRFGAWWLWFWNVRRLLRSYVHRSELPRDLITGELRGSLQGLRRYARARQAAREIAERFRGREPDLPDDRPEAGQPAPAPPGAVSTSGIAVREVDVAQPLRPIENPGGCGRLRLFVRCGTRLIGSLDVESPGIRVSVHRLREELARLELRLLNTGPSRDVRSARAELMAALRRHLVARAGASGVPDVSVLPVRERRPPSVSVVVATRDRPDDLRRCLAALAGQQTARPVEVVVVDNNPRSGLTAPVAAGRAGVVLVEETRAGLSYARNAGIAASRGDIIVCTDDDVVAPPDWIEKLTAPLVRADVMVVTGNVLPLELDTRSQQLFEAYGGLSRGLTRLEADGEWFRRWRRSVPTWELGSTANAAFRASIFSNPAIGLLDEALGAGMPTGCSEDTYLFYRVLQAGYTIVYEPDAYVWHRHRRDLSAVRRQIYAYSKGHVAYQLTTWLRDGDRRALVRFGFELPRTYWRRLRARLLGRSDYPLGLLALEVMGNLAGPFALWRARVRVSRQGRSAPVLPAGKRTPPPAPTTEPAADRLSA